MPTSSIECKHEIQPTRTNTPQMRNHSKSARPITTSHAKQFRQRMPHHTTPQRVGLRIANTRDMCRMKMQSRSNMMFDRKFPQSTDRNLKVSKYTSLSETCQSKERRRANVSFYCLMKQEDHRINDTRIK